MLLNASEEGDLSGVLWDWDPNWSQAGLVPTTTALGKAVVDLVEAELVTAFPSGASPDAGALGPREVAAVVADPRAWWNGDEGLTTVLWLVLTEAGRSELAALSRDELYSYQNRPRDG